MKIVIIGAASGFGSRLSIDILSVPALQDCHIALCDIHGERLEKVQQYVQRAIDQHKLPATCSASTNHTVLLPGADVVVTAVSIGGPSYWGEPFYSEINIPRKYGVDQYIGDTLGIGGVFRFLRTATEHLQFCKDMEKHCPGALMLNYTNPMAMLTWLHSVETSIQNVGLCHSVQGTTKMLAEACGAPYDEVSYHVAGINHQAWLLKFRHNGSDLYPKLREVADTATELADDRVRVEIMKQFGYFVTESSKHMSEYVPYFRRNDALLEEFKLLPKRIVPMEYTDSRRVWAKDSGVEQDENAQNIELIRSHEYASSIIEGLHTGEPKLFNGNVMNRGSITNLPENSCVEVPCVVDKEGLHICHVGALPTQCAALNRTNINVQELAVEAFRTRSKETAFHAVAVDPLTASILTLDQIREMFNELWEAEKDHLAFMNRA